MEIPENLIELERAAEMERARLAGLVGEAYDEQRMHWRDAAAAAQAAITAHAEAAAVNRYELEQAVKKAVRYASQDPAE